MNPRDLVEYEEAKLRRELAREEESNRVYAERCPGARETECYQRGPLPPSSFYTTREFLRYHIDREHARFNPARCSTLLGSGGLRRKP
jgi:hypothetical protein